MVLLPMILIVGGSQDIEDFRQGCEAGGEGPQLGAAGAHDQVAGFGGCGDQCADAVSDELGADIERHQVELVPRDEDPVRVHVLVSPTSQGR